MEKLIAQRKGHRGWATRMIKAITDLQTASSDPPSTRTISLLTSYATRLTDKLSVLETLDSKIMDLLSDPGAIEAEVMETSEFTDGIQVKLWEISQISKPLPSTDDHSEPPPPPPPLSPTPSSSFSDVDYDDSEPGSFDNPSSITGTQSSAAAVTSAPHRAAAVKLPKLTLPRFSGDPLAWQAFWDAFSAAVDTNAFISDVEKFSYLRAQLHGPAAQCISGFAQTNANYRRALDLLKDRFGRVHIITNAHMQALLQLTPPHVGAASLREFYDSVESHIRGLEALGKDPATFGDFLVPVILEKLPATVTSTITRTHGTAAWELNDLRAALQTEVHVLEASRPSNTLAGSATPTPTAVFTARTKQHQPKAKTDRRCRYCSATTHSTFHCPVVSDVDSRVTFIQGHKLCFNCLGTHHISACRSKLRCYHCDQNHHPSICRRRRAAASNTADAAQLSEQVPPPPSSANVSAVVDVHTTTSSTHVLLKTAVATVRAPSTHLASTANILFDEGAQRSFITQSLADTLHLPVDE